jgi:predicted ATPase
MTTSKPCSDILVPAITPRRRLVVLDGMPGAGKTTLATALAASGARVLGEYTNAAGATVPIGAHPAAHDDTAHQGNWVRKAAQAADALTSGRVVYADRDWLSALAYACSIASHDDGQLLRQRASWALGCLRQGALLLPGTWVVFQLDAATSLHRRAGRLRPGHPWSEPGPLRRLQDFYAAPALAVSRACPALGALLLRAGWQHVTGPGDPQHVLRLLRDLARRT